MATIQTSKSTPRDCHNHSAKDTAIWVLPQDHSQSRDAFAPTQPGTSTTAAPGSSSAPRAGALSGLGMKPWASGGTAPDRIGHATPPPRDSVGPPAGTRLSMAATRDQPKRSLYIAFRNYVSRLSYASYRSLRTPGMPGDNLERIARA